MMTIGETDGRAYLCDAAPVGVGGQAEVFRATDEAGGAWAVKLAHPGQNPALEQGIRQLRLLARMPGVADCVVPLVDTGWDGDRRFLVLPWRHWRLDQWVRGRDLDERLEAMAALIRAVLRLHAAGVVHRDIKGSNACVLTRDDGGIDVQLADFATAVSDRVQREPLPAVYSAGFTPLDAVAQPHHRPKHSWDIHALAVTVFASLTGHPPQGVIQGGGVLPDADQRSLRLALPSWVRTTTLPPAQRNPWVEHVATRLVAALSHALDTDPGRRSGSAFGLESAVARARDAVAGAVIGRPPATLRTSPPPEPEPALPAALRADLVRGLGDSRTARGSSPSTRRGWFGVAVFGLLASFAYAVGYFREVTGAPAPGWCRIPPWIPRELGLARDYLSPYLVTFAVTGVLFGAVWLLARRGWGPRWLTHLATPVAVSHTPRTR